MLCQDDDGPLYVKFGKTRRLYGRLRQVGQGSPIPAKWFAFVEVPAHRKGNIEKLLHEVFADRKTRGEWFRFDPQSDEDKRAFNDGSRKAFRMGLLGESAGWSKVSVAALDAHAKERSFGYLRAMRGKNDTRRARKRAWSELENYGTG